MATEAGHIECPPDRSCPYKSFKEWAIYPEERRWVQLDDADEADTMSTSAPLDELSFLYFLRTLPMERDTLFRIASITKPVTSIAVMMLMEEGKLNLDDPVTKWLPELSGMLVLEDAAGPLDKTAAAGREITVEDLLTHRAGLAYGFTSVGPIAHAHEKKLGSPMVNPLTPDEWLKGLGELPLS